MNTQVGFQSQEYWEDRYRQGGNSGAGSYGRLAEFKAEIVNAFVKSNNINSILEFGVGDGNQLSLFNFANYVGCDVSENALSRCREAFAHREDFHFVDFDGLAKFDKADLTLSLDVVSHLVEDDVFERYINAVFLHTGRFALFYSSDIDASWNAKHLRHRNFTKFVARRYPEWRHLATVKNRFPFESTSPSDTSFCDFFLFGKPGYKASLHI